MSLIKVSTDDQKIFILEKPDIFSGDVNTDEVEFSFCDAWAGFVKTAVFYTDENNPYKVDLDANNRAVIPHEVMTEPGTMYFSVYGVNGDKRLTSAVVPYKIGKGAITTENTSSPGNGFYSSRYPDWSRFTWYVMGDSLTDRNSKNAQGIPFTNKFYYDFIQEKTGIKLIVDGIGCTGYKNNSGGETFLDRVKKIPEYADVVTVFGSGNDLKKDDLKYSDSEIWDTLKWLLENRPGLRVIVVPPSLWKKTDTHDYTKWNDLWRSYCERLELCAFKCNHRYLSDMYDCPPFYPDFDKHMKKFFTTDPNGIHPNEEGHKALAPYFYNALYQELAFKL